MHSLPDFVTKDQVDTAIRALGIEPRGLGLVSLEVGIHRIAVRRWVKRDGRLIPGKTPLAPSVIEIPIDRADGATSSMMEIAEEDEFAKYDRESGRA